jgi:prephenate dehydratase
VPTIEALGRAFVEAMRAATRSAEQTPLPASGFAGAAVERPVVQRPKEVGVALEKDAEFGLLRAVTVTVQGTTTRFLVVRDEDSHQVARLESADTTFAFEHDRSGTLTHVSMTTQRFA